MKIYTKTGDKGTTALIGGKRVPKNHIRIEAYGTADELISFVGMLRDNEINRKHKDFLLKVQEDLMVISALLASGSDDLTIKLPSLSDSNINYLEKEIDRLDKNLKPLKSFIISGGDIAISTCHVARTVCRRLERVVLSLKNSESIPEYILIYLNRLSDYLFTLARAIAADKNIIEIIWKPQLDK